MLIDSLLCFMGPRDRTQVLRLASQHAYPLATFPVLFSLEKLFLILFLSFPSPSTRWLAPGTLRDSSVLHGEPTLTHTCSHTDTDACLC